MKTLGISKHIYTYLMNSKELREVVGDKIYPIATKNEVTFPFIVYQRESLSPLYDKGGMSTVSSNVNIYILSESYSQSIDIAEIVVKALDRVDADYLDFRVIGASLIAADEDYINQTYVQKLTFNFRTK